MKASIHPPLPEMAGEETINKLRDLILVAQGKKEATLLLKNCRLVNVYSGEIYRTDIGVYKDQIASITAGAVTEAQEVIDCQDSFAIPGLIDPHMHVDTTMLWPNELARALVPLGTTTVFVDTVNVAHNGGAAAVQALMDAFKGLPLHAYFSAPSYCPLDPELETAAAEIDSKDIAAMLQWDNVVSIGETVSSKILNLEPDFLARLATCQAMDKIISGHSGDLPRGGHEPALDAYIASGVRDDHCVESANDIMPHLRRGLSMFLVEAPGRERIGTFFEHILTHKLPTEKMSLCIDNITIMDIVGGFGGYIDKPLRIGLHAGLPAVDMIRMATLNPATHYKKDGQLGSLTPGRLADIVLLRELDVFPPEIVISGGKVVARQGKMLEDIEPPAIPTDYLHSVRLPAGFSADSFKVPVSDKPTAKVRVIKADDGEAMNQCYLAELKAMQGDVQPDLERDILKMAIIERYGRRGSHTTAFVSGFHLQRGAIATSYSVPSNNIVVVGTNKRDMAVAVNHLEKIQGGFVVVDDGVVLAEVSLRIGGIMSAAPYENVLVDVEKANAAARALGCPLQHPFFTMAQTVLSSLPALGLTDRGLVDVLSGNIIDVVVDEL